MSIFYGQNVNGNKRLSYNDIINLKMAIGDLFVAGTETTSTTILWSILYFLHYPQVYQKCYKEIQDVVGSGRLPSVKDKVNMPYFEAFNMEILRHVNIVLVGVPRAVKEDTVYQGHFIPKNAIILPNVDSVLASDEIWGDARAFRPERFLDEMGRVIHREEWIPFSIGRRNCLGEGLAKMEQFLFLATLVQRFDFQAEDPQNIPPLKGNYGITHAPMKYNVQSIPR
ncbi:hypothetical protein LOTGIDRAFT_231056 [Lottia gigantea]|uniref:Uncharacterized protein n=1 Tax=Lottia gigantea TaxID=225164 RepID=V4B042_LOTGI|nr:hypothetical protein LOTGIDRAFT_231056 [Lottia gigantea]ESO99391.1 hypothetical protein LOTGIDRAFT_231056 [Lottia gigantea]